MNIHTFFPERRAGDRRAAYALPVATFVILIAMYFCTASIVRRLELLEVESKEGRQLAERFIADSKSNDKALLERMTNLEKQQRILEDKQADYSDSIESLRRLVKKKYSKDSN